MTRSKEFERGYVLDQAVNVFWQQGFEKTSLADLRKKMEISNQSLYNEFTDKYNLFLEAFDRYNEIGKIYREELLMQPESDLASVITYIEYLLELYTETPGYGGCLLCNSIAEFGDSDPIIYNKILNENKRIEDALSSAIKNAISLGQISIKINAKVLAKFISTYMNGISNMSKSGVKRKELQKQVDLLFDMIIATD